MNLRVGAVLLVAGLVGLLGATASTAGAVRDRYGGAGDDDQRAVDLLRRSATAMRTTSYTGTRLISAWGREHATTVLVDVEHVAGQGTRLTVRGGGVPQDTAAFLASGGSGGRQADALTLETFELLTDAYAVTLGPRDSVAGRPSQVVEVRRGEAAVGRLWVDERTGLLLRREVLDLSGRLVRESTFIDVEVAVSGFMAHLPPTTPEPFAEGVGLRSRSALEHAGWDCPHQAGPMRLVAIEALGRPGALHMTYSDGLTRMSVFEQRGALDPEAVRGFALVRFGGQLVHVREGMPTYAVWEDDGLVFTAVTDGPLGSVAAAVASEPPRPEAEPGFWTRVANGLARLGGWANPLV